MSRLLAILGLINFALAEVTKVTDQAQIDLILKLHNDERAKNSLPPMEWDDELAAFAAEKPLATSCSLGKMKHTEKSENPGYGENLAANSESDTTSLITKGVNGWNEELQWYDYDANKCSAPPNKACGHYTQVVWDVSTKVGCAFVTGCSGEYGNFFGCNYKKQGNMCGWKPYGRTKDEMCNCEGSSLCSPDGLFADPYNTKPCVPGEDTKTEGNLKVTRTISCDNGCTINFSYDTGMGGGSGMFMAGPSSGAGPATCPASYIDWATTMKKAKDASGGGGGGAPSGGGGGWGDGGMEIPGGWHEMKKK